MHVHWEHMILRDPEAHMALIPCQTPSGEPVDLIVTDKEATCLGELLPVDPKDVLSDG